MIDPISAFAMLTSAHSALKKCVSMGKDLSSATSAIASYAKAEAELGFAKEQKKKGIFGSVMDQAIEQHFKEEEQNRLKDELRSLFLLYGSAGQWEIVLTPNPTLLVWPNLLRQRLASPCPQPSLVLYTPSTRLARHRRPTAKVQE